MAPNASEWLRKELEFMSEFVLHIENFKEINSISNYTLESADTNAVR